MSAQMPSLTRSFSNLSNASTLFDEDNEEVNLGKAPSVKDLERYIEIAKGVPNLDSIDQLTNKNSKTAGLLQGLTTPQTPLLKKKETLSPVLFEQEGHSITQSKGDELLLTNKIGLRRSRPFGAFVMGFIFTAPALGAGLLTGLTHAPLVLRVGLPLGFQCFGIAFGAIVGLEVVEKQQDSAV